MIKKAVGYDYSATESIPVEDSIKLYFKDIRNIPLLTREEEIELSQKAQAGDMQARNKMVKANLRLVIKIAKQYLGYAKMPLLDLIQEGNIGLIKAVMKFDADKGCKFSTYAAYWIKQSMFSAITEKNKTIRIPANVLNAISKLNKATTELSQILGREPTIEELSEKLSISKKKVKELQNIIKEPMSLNSQINDEDDCTLEEIVPDNGAVSPYAAAEEDSIKTVLNEVLDTLSPREKEVLCDRYGLNNGASLTLEEVGKKFGLTKERIRQIEEKALRKMRNPIRAERLREFLE